MTNHSPVILISSDPNYKVINPRDLKDWVEELGPDAAVEQIQKVYEPLLKTAYQKGKRDQIATPLPLYTRIWIGIKYMWGELKHSGYNTRMFIYENFPAIFFTFLVIVIIFGIPILANSDRTSDAMNISYCKAGDTVYCLRAIKTADSANDTNSLLVYQKAYELKTGNSLSTTGVITPVKK